jgi:hypothetical protein
MNPFECSQFGAPNSTMNPLRAPNDTSSRANTKNSTPDAIDNMKLYTVTICANQQDKNSGT